MTRTVKFDFAGDLILVHRIITRSLDVSIESGNAFSTKGFPDSDTRSGYFQYMGCAVRFMHEHHRNEDEVAFPELEKLLPDVPYDLLKSQHRDMIKLLDEITGSKERFMKEKETQGFPEDMLVSLDELKKVWQAHIKEEEGHFAPDTISPDISMNERVRIGKLSSRFGRKHSKPISLMLPFVLYNLSFDDREHLAETIPAIATSFLAPVVWRSKWKKMRPFLKVD